MSTQLRDPKTGRFVKAQPESSWMRPADPVVPLRFNQVAEPDSWNGLWVLVGALIGCVGSGLVYFFLYHPH